MIEEVMNGLIPTSTIDMLVSENPGLDLAKARDYFLGLRGPI